MVSFPLLPLFVSMEKTRMRSILQTNTGEEMER